MQALKKAEEKQQEAPDGLKGEVEPTLRELADELSLEPVGQAEKPGKEKTSEDARPDAVRKAPPKAGREDFQTAANVFSAKSPPTSEPGQRKRVPLLVGAAALLLAVGGAYVYVEVNHPALWRSLSSKWLPNQAAVMPPTRPISAPSQPVPTNDPMSVRMIPPEEMIQAEMIQTAPAEGMFKTPLTEKHLAEQGSLAREAAHKPVAPETGIKITRAEPGVINPELSNAYDAMQAGRLEVAQTHYQRVLQQEPRNLDALLGQAAIATRMGYASDAGRLYLRALEVEPGNLYAQAGFLGMMGSADPAGSETRLKQLLAGQPASFLYVALGNLYAGQSRWSEAQQAYFQAFHLEPGSPDTAFNLAVSLDQLNQPRQALDYYKQALMLSRGKSASFETRALEARIAQLQGR